MFQRGANTEWEGVASPRHCGGCAIRDDLQEQIFSVLGDGPCLVALGAQGDVDDGPDAERCAQR